MARHRVVRLLLSRFVALSTALALLTPATGYGQTCCTGDGSCCPKDSQLLTRADRCCRSLEADRQPVASSAFAYNQTPTIGYVPIVAASSLLIAQETALAHHAVATILRI